MLEKLRIKNFKAHEDTDLDLRPITIFIGPNNSGKSSVLQFLLLLKSKSFESKKNLRLYDESFLRTWKGEDVLNIHSYNLIDLGDNFNMLKNDLLKETVFSIQSHFLLTDAFHNAAGIKRMKHKYYLGFNKDMEIDRIEYFSTIDDNYEINFENDINGISHFSNKGLPIELKISYQGGVFDPFNNTNLSYPENFSREEINKNNVIIQTLLKSNQLMMDSISFVYGIRGFELSNEEIYDIKSKRTEYMGLPQRSISLGNSLISDNEMKEKVSNWFKHLGLGEIYTEVKKGKYVIIKVKTINNTQIINEGLGSQQMLHMFIPIALAEELDTIMIEEPEIHLHPGTQAELMELFMRVWKEEKKQFIMSTHSEHIIYPLLSAISKGDLKKEDVNIIFFNKEEGVVKTRSLEIDDKGRVKGGLPGFFEQNLDEMIDFLEN